LSQELAILTKDLTKVFGTQRSVDAINLSVPKGSVFGFLGPNGSGKTTTIRMLLGLSTATSGEIELLGHQMPKQKSVALAKVGALVEGPAFYPYMSGRDNLLRLDAADQNSDPKTSHQRVDGALERVGLSAAAKKKTHAYSLGMKQRLGLANALLKPREILILDEPTNGLDPQGTREVRNLIRSLANDGYTIFLSSHLLSEIEQLCTDVAVMRGGKIVAQASLAELSKSDTGRLIVRVDDPEAAKAILAQRKLNLIEIQGGFMAEVAADFEVANLNAELVAKKIAVSEIRIELPSLEEKFVSLTGEGFDVLQ
jgi:ABC-type multidrug transport system ATPase subunit